MRNKSFLYEIITQTYCYTCYNIIAWYLRLSGLLAYRSLSHHEEVRVVSDQWRTPTFVGDVSLGIEKLIARAFNKTAPAVSSIYHICGNECLTIAEIAYRVATILGLDKSLIHPVTTQEMQEKTPRPRFSGMSTLKAQKELDYTPLSLDKGIKEMFESL